MEALLNPSLTQLSWQTILLGPLAAFVISTLLAVVYHKTHQGLSYQRSLLQALILGSIVASLIMMAIGDNLARGIGIVGSLAIIRFRTNLRDPRDMVFVFAALGVGVACGVQAYLPAALGGAVFIMAAFLLRYSTLGQRRPHDGLIRFQIPSKGESSEAVAAVLKSSTHHFALITVREIAQGGMLDCAYQVRLKDPDDPHALLRSLETLEGLTGLSYMNQQQTVEA